MELISKNCFHMNDICLPYFVLVSNDWKHFCLYIDHWNLFSVMFTIFRRLTYFVFCFCFSSTSNTAQLVNLAKVHLFKEQHMESKIGLDFCTSTIHVFNLS